MKECVKLGLIIFLAPFIVFAQANPYDAPAPQSGPIPYTGPYRKDCGGKSSGEAQVLSLPVKLETCNHPVGELRWVLVNAGGFKYLIAVRTVENGSNISYNLTVREDASGVDPVNDPNNLFIKLEPRPHCVCSDYNYDLYVYDGNNPGRLIQSSTRSGTSIEELEIPLVNSSVPAQSTAEPASNACDQTAKAIVDASGGCSNIDSTLYKNVYNACCTVVTKAGLLQMLNDALADGVLSNTEKLSLLGALDRYLSAIPASNASQTTGGGGDTATESFRASCRNIKATDSTIQAECQRINGSWVSAYYRRVGCSTDIANIDGVLLCATAGGGGGGSSGGGSRCTPPTGCPSYAPWLGCGTCWPDSNSCHSRNTSNYGDDCTTCRKCP